MNRRNARAAAAGIISFAVVSAMLLAPPAGAAEGNAGEERPNSLRPGSWSIQFEITDKLGLIPFDDMIVSLKRHLTRRSALRLGLNIGLSYQDEAREYEYINFPIKAAGLSTTQNAQSAVLEPVWLHYFNPGSTFNLFAGAGPFFSFSRSRAETSDLGREDRIYMRRWGIGLLGLGGAEWFATKTISLHAEYRLSGAFYRRYQENTQTYYSEDDTNYRRQTLNVDEWRFEGVDVMLGLSFFF